jgi:quinol monooxygenase YgiN
VIKVRGERHIRPGCLDEFKSVVAAATVHHRNNDGPGTLAFETYLDVTNGVWIALESYTDSDAMLAHLAARLPELTERVARVSDIGRSEVYGVPSKELAALLARLGHGVTIYQPLDSL